MDAFDAHRPAARNPNPRIYLRLRVGAVASRAAVGDRSKNQVDVVDPSQKVITSSITLSDYPDYLRYVATTCEIWVSEPYHLEIEVLSVSTDNPPVLAPVTMIGVGSVPEGLGVDSSCGCAPVLKCSECTYPPTFGAVRRIARRP